MKLNRNFYSTFVASDLFLLYIISLMLMLILNTILGDAANLLI